MNNADAMRSRFDSSPIRAKQTWLDVAKSSVPLPSVTFTKFPRCGFTITADTLTRLRALPIPTGQAAALKAIYAKVDTVLADVDPLIAALRSGSPTAETLMNRLDASQNAANAASNAYGLTVCGS